jgi:Tfp pilus assembly protein PilN
MIRINLLPAEQRRGNRLPPKVLAAAFGGALAVSGAIGWFGLVYFGDLGKAESALAAVDVKLAERQKHVTYHDQLEANKKESALRVQTIHDIAKSRRVWSKFLDEVVDVVNNNGDTERHVAWFNSIQIKNDPVKGATISMPSSVQDADRSRLANFHEDLEASPFAKDLLSKSDPSYKVEEDKQRTPSTSMQFNLQLQLQPTVQSKPAPKAAAPAPAKK